MENLMFGEKVTYADFMLLSESVIFMCDFFFSVNKNLENFFSILAIYTAQKLKALNL
jgi:hypothetical protein